MRKETWAASFEYGHNVSCGVFTVCSPTPEAVIMVLIADCIRIRTVTVLQTDIGHTEATVTLLPGLAVCVLQTLAPVVSQVTDGGGVSAVRVHVTCGE